MTDEGFEILNKDLKDIMHYDHITKLRDYNPMVIIELSILKGALCESHNNAEWKVALLMSLREKWNTMKECSNLLIEFQNQAYSKL